MATTHEQQCRTLIHVLASIFIKDQIKLKHLASYFHLFLPEYASNYFACIHVLLSQIIINGLFSSENVFLYVVMQNWPPPVAFDRRWTILTTTFISLWI